MPITNQPQNLNMNQDPRMILGELIKSGLNKVKKVQDMQIEEAMSQGVPAEQVVSELVNKYQGGMQGQSPQQPAQDPMQQPQPQNKQGNFFHTPFQIDQQTGQVTPESILGGLIKASPVDTLRMVQANTQNDKENRDSLIRNRNLESELMQRQLEGGDTDKVYRDPVTGMEVDPIQAQKDMEEGLGIYQVNQRVSTRAGVVERPLNKIPDLTQEEKKYVNDARILGNSLTTLESGFDSLFEKYGDANWQSVQIEKLPYFLAQDQDVQDLKSELTYLKAGIPFLRGGKQLTPAEAKRIDAMLNPFGKNKKTYKKDIQRFQDEFLAGSEIMKFGINAGLMKKLIRGKTEKSQGKESSEMSDEQAYQEYLRMKGGQ